VTPESRTFVDSRTLLTRRRVLLVEQMLTDQSI
jgi:hypothetical protein